jgi:hypothetical protein
LWRCFLASLHSCRTFALPIKRVFWPKQKILIGKVLWSLTWLEISFRGQVFDILAPSPLVVPSWARHVEWSPIYNMIELVVSGKVSLSKKKKSKTQKSPLPQYEKRQGKVSSSDSIMLDKVSDCQVLLTSCCPEL